MKRRKLRKWVIVTLNVVKCLLSLCLIMILVGAFMNAWADAHYERLARYGEVYGR